MQNPLPRVVQIGFNKTGTSSLGRFFKQNGYSVASVSQACQIMENINACVPAFQGLEFNLYQDLENHRKGVYVYNYFKEIYSQYPSEYYILTTRSCESWIRSRLLHQNGNYARIAMNRLRVSNLDDLCSTWRNEFYVYHSKVLSFFEGKRNFYIHALEEINVGKLMSFLCKDYIFVNTKYPRVVTGKRIVQRNDLPDVKSYLEII
jgi:hypothetical protein